MKYNYYIVIGLSAKFMLFFIDNRLTDIQKLAYECILYIYCHKKSNITSTLDLSMKHHTAEIIKV